MPRPAGRRVTCTGSPAPAGCWRRSWRPRRRRPRRPGRPAGPGGDHGWRAREPHQAPGRVGGLAVAVVAAAPFAYLWVQQLRGADDPLTLQVGLTMAIWTAVFSVPG